MTIEILALGACTTSVLWVAWHQRKLNTNIQDQKVMLETELNKINTRLANQRQVRKL